MTFATYFNPGVSLQGGSGSGTASLPISGNGATITTSTPLIDGTQTWNNAAVTFTAAKINVTNTASAAASLLMDLQVGTASQFSVGKSGQIGNPSGNLDIYTFGSLGSGSNRRISIAQTSVSIGPNGGVALNMCNSNTIGWTSDGSPNSDLLLSRRAAANLRFGTFDAAAPVAQTLSVQSVVAGTSNTAGANLTITGSQGTGTGVGGSIIFQVAPAGGSGTAQNALATALTIASNRTVIVGAAYTVATLPAAGTQGRRAWVTDATVPTFLGTLTGGGAVVCPVFDNGTAWVSA